MHEYSLSSQEGVALMCLAEALLRIPDMATRDALIRDKIATGDWRAHIGGGRSLFVNAATWGLVRDRQADLDRQRPQPFGCADAADCACRRAGDPPRRRHAMRMMGEQFGDRRDDRRGLEARPAAGGRGFRYSYDMLGEAATTAADARRYYADYEAAIHAIGKAANGRGIYEGPGISIKLSALHPATAAPKQRG